MDDRELYNVLAKRLENSHIDAVLNEMEKCGVFDAIEEDPQTLFPISVGRRFQTKTSICCAQPGIPIPRQRFCS